MVPGFVDLHVHGGGGGSYASGIAEEALTAARTHLLHGTTTTVASTVTGEIDEVCHQAAVLSELVEDGILAGVHFEGPFISHNRCGAHRPDLLRDPDPTLVRKLVDAARGHATMVTLAPELPGGLESVRMLADLGVIAAVGHTDSDYAKTLEAIEAGATVATHLFNAMPGIQHRAPGPIIALLEDERVTVELINDGVHLHPSVLDLAYRTAGASRVALITDAMGAAGMGDGLYPSARSRSASRTASPDSSRAAPSPAPPSPSTSPSDAPSPSTGSASTRPSNPSAPYRPACSAATTRSAPSKRARTPTWSSSTPPPTTSSPSCAAATGSPAPNASPPSPPPPPPDQADRPAPRGERVRTASTDRSTPSVPGQPFGDTVIWSTRTVPAPAGTVTVTVFDPAWSCGRM